MTGQQTFKIMPQFLYRIQPTRPGMLTEGPTEREGAIVNEHFEYLQKIVAEGVVFMAGRTRTLENEPLASSFLKRRPRQRRWR